MGKTVRRWWNCTGGEEDQSHQQCQQLSLNIIVPGRTHRLQGVHGGPLCDVQWVTRGKSQVDYIHPLYAFILNC